MFFVIVHPLLLCFFVIVHPLLLCFLYTYIFAQTADFVRLCPDSVKISQDIPAAAQVGENITFSLVCLFVFVPVCADACSVDRILKSNY